MASCQLLRRLSNGLSPSLARFANAIVSTDNNLKKLFFKAALSHSQFRQFFMAVFSFYLILLFGLLIVVSLAIAIYAKIKRKRFLYLCLFVCSVMLCLMSLLITNDRITSDSDLRVVDLGWPYTFVSQNQHMHSPPYPYHARWSWQAPNRVEYFLFILNILIYFSALLAMFSAIELIMVNIRKRSGSKN